jgi:curved DNA-binding protein
VGGGAWRQSDHPDAQREHPADHPPGSQAGQRLRIKGKGLASKTATGDLYAVIKIVMPPKPNEKASALWQQLADAEAGFEPRQAWGKA